MMICSHSQEKKDGGDIFSSKKNTVMMRALDEALL